MCGIAGVFATNGASLPARAAEAVEAGLAALGHRGPDDSGLVERPGVVLGHRRLAVLDLEGGQQPFADPAGRHVLVYNGELYAFDDVRAKLDAVEPMRTRSDTEVLLRCLASHGVDGLDMLNGMYAFALYDAGNEQLTLAVDPVGIKPLYVAERDGWLAFASELTAICGLLEHLGEALSLDGPAMAECVVNGWVGAPRTLVHRVAKLRPGESVIFPRGRTAVRRLRELPGAAPQAKGAEGAGTIEILREAVHDQLVADVPVGLFLSGGIDSSLLLALGSEIHGPLQTFSVGFQASRDVSIYDESPFARLAAEHFGSVHRELQVDQGTVFLRMDEIVAAVDEPIADPAVIPLFVLSEFAAQHVKVCLTGDGGDELFGGYQYHRVRRLKGLIHQPSAAGALLRGSLNLLHGAGTASGLVPKRLRTVIGLALEPGIAPNIAARPWLPEPFAAAEKARSRVDWRDADQILQASMKGPLAGAMLPKTDRITMRHGLEARVPFLDDRVIGAARALPWSAKVSWGQTKYVLRRALAERAPPALASRSKKGFRVPLDEWFRGALAVWLRERIGPGSAVETVFGAAVPELLAQHAAGTANHGNVLWALSIIEDWLRRVDGRVSSA